MGFGLVGVLLLGVLGFFCLVVGILFPFIALEVPLAL